MAKYGARYVRWAPFADTNPEPENAYPNYGEPATMTKLVKISDNPNIAEGKLYGDDELAEYAAEVVDADVDLEVTEITNEMGGSMLGAELDENGDLTHGVDDNPPYGGLGFVTCKVVDNVKSYQGIYYPKLKAQIQGEDFGTKGESINFTTGRLRLKAVSAANGKWKRRSKDKKTFAEAKAWVDERIKKAGS